MNRNVRKAWIIDEGEFYELETWRDQMEFLVRYAILAPSPHNAQPWRFRIVEGGVEVFADFTRRLPIADRNDSELLMSVGAAITNLRVAAAHFSYESSVMYETRLLESYPVAFLSLRETCDPDRALSTLFPAIQRRHSHRVPFEPEPVLPEAMHAIAGVVDANPSTLQMVLPRDVDRVGELVEKAGKALLARPAYRAELADWVRTDGQCADGLPSGMLGIPRILSGAAPWLVRNFDAGEWKGPRDRKLAEASGLLVLVTSDDDRVALVRTGEVVEKLLLTIVSNGLQYSLLNEAIEVPHVRKELGILVGTDHPPQLLIRIGVTAEAGHPTPRRPVETVLAE